jgi:Mrp family chromosome partitioning ATPase
VILVAKPGATKLSALRQAYEQLRSVGARVLGVVLNEVNPRSRKYGYYYKGNYSKYSYYYQSGGVKQKKTNGLAQLPQVLAQLPPGEVDKPDADKILPPLKMRN